MIEKIAHYFATQLSLQTNCADKEEIEVLQYGIECIINTMIPFIVILLFSVMHNKSDKMIVWSILFLLLRNYIGGYHAPSHVSCIVLSCIYGIISIQCIDLLKFVSIHIKLELCVILFIIYIFAGPIISDKSLQNKKKYIFRRGLMILLSYISFAFILSFVSVLSDTVFLSSYSAGFLYLVELIHKCRHTVHRYPPNYR